MKKENIWNKPLNAPRYFTFLLAIEMGLIGMGYNGSPIFTIIGLVSMCITVAIGINMEIGWEIKRINEARG